ncbi:MAG: hypothetical protein LBH01_02135 [Verrucomicrobiales bacterium]|jgi:hypothetical protein|nr:hypothetical protein [Verrucomicrobiales bacterium]
MKRKSRDSTPYTDAVVDELRPLLEPRGRKSSLARWLANGEQKLVDARRVTVNKILKRTDTNMTVEMFFRIKAWAKANKLDGGRYI